MKVTYNKVQMEYALAFLIGKNPHITIHGMRKFIDSAIQDLVDDPELISISIGGLTVYGRFEEEDHMVVDFLVDPMIGEYDDSDGSDYETLHMTPKSEKPTQNALKPTERRGFEFL